jgi:hypothetical protein
MDATMLLASAEHPLNLRKGENKNVQIYVTKDYRHF